MNNLLKNKQLRTVGSVLGMVFLWLMWLSFFEENVVSSIWSFSSSGNWDWLGLDTLNTISCTITLIAFCAVTFRHYRNKKRALWVTSTLSGLTVLVFATLSSFIGYASGLEAPQITDDEAEKLIDIVALSRDITSEDIIRLPGYSIEYAKGQFLVLSKPTSYWMSQMPLRSRRVYRHNDYRWSDREALEKSRNTLHNQFIPNDFASTRKNIEDHLASKGRLVDIEKQHGHSYDNYGTSDFVRFMDWRHPGKIYAILYLSDDVELTVTGAEKVTAKWRNTPQPTSDQIFVRAIYALDIPSGTTPYDVWKPDSFLKSFRHSFRYGIDEIGKDFIDRISKYKAILKAMFGLYDINSAIQDSDACWVTSKECLSISDATINFYKAIEEDNAQTVAEEIQHAYLTEGKIKKGWDMAKEYKSTNTVSTLIPVVDEFTHGAWLDKELDASVKANNKKMVGALLDDRITGNSWKNRETLFWAVENSNPPIVNLLLEHGFSADTKGNYGLRPILIAARSGNTGMIETLLNHGADINTSDSNGETVLQYAIKDEYQTNVLLMLFENPDLDVNEMDRQFYIEKLRQYIQMNASNSIALDEVKVADWKSGKLIDYLDKYGNSLNPKPESFNQTPWHCISDEISGLSWTVKHNLGGLHDNSLNYWDGESDNPVCQQRICDINELVRLSNNNKLCGHNDWRIPSVTELASLAFPQYKSAFPFPPGYLFWTYYGDSLVITSADGILGEHNATEDPFSDMDEPHAKVLLVSGDIRPMPEEPDMDYQAKFFEK